jgi:hypothetical protein
LCEKALLDHWNTWQDHFEAYMSTKQMV